MTTPAQNPPRINPGGLIAALPGLLRCPLTDSVVLVGFLTAPDLAPRCVLHGDVPAAAEVCAVSAQLSTAVIAHEIDLAAVVIIADADDAAGDLPHRDLPQALMRAFDDAHVEVADAVWVARIDHGAAWRSYLDPSRAGTLPDPGSSPITTTAVLAGDRPTITEWHPITELGNEETRSRRPASNTSTPTSPDHSFTTDEFLTVGLSGRPSLHPPVLLVLDGGTPSPRTTLCARRPYGPSLLDR